MSKLFVTDAKVTSKKFGVTAALRMPSIHEVAVWQKNNAEFLNEGLMQVVDLCIDFNYEPEEGDTREYLREFPQALIQDLDFIKELVRTAMPFLGIDPDKIKADNKVEHPPETIAKN